MRIVNILLDRFLWCELLLRNIALLFFDIILLTRYLRIHRLIKQAIYAIVNKLGFPFWTVTPLVKIVGNMIFFCLIIVKLMFVVQLCQNWKIDVFLNSCLESLNIRLRLELILFNSNLLLRYRLIL
jgi:hypothetical protein